MGGGGMGAGPGGMGPGGLGGGLGGPGSMGGEGPYGEKELPPGAIRTEVAELERETALLRQQSELESAFQARGIVELAAAHA